MCQCDLVMCILMQEDPQCSCIGHHLSTAPQNFNFALAGKPVAPLPRVRSPKPHAEQCSAQQGRQQTNMPSAPAAAELECWASPTSVADASSKGGVPAGFTQVKVKGCGSRAHACLTHTPGHIYYVLPPEPAHTCFMPLPHLLWC